MKIIIIAGFIVFGIFAVISYRSFKAKSEAKQGNNQDISLIKTPTSFPNAGIIPSANEILDYAKGICTRTALYQLLRDSGKAYLFPNEYLSIEKASEGYLAIWLKYPTELGACPDQIEFIKKVTINLDGHDIYYYVYKFRVNEPNKFATIGWMLGVVGPYFDDSKPYDYPGATFSRFSKADEVTAEEEADWVHKNIALRQK